MVIESGNKICVNLRNLRDYFSKRRKEAKREKYDFS